MDFFAIICGWISFFFLFLISVWIYALHKDIIHQFGTNLWRYVFPSSCLKFLITNVSCSYIYISVKLGSKSQKRTTINVSSSTAKEIIGNFTLHVIK